MRRSTCGICRRSRDVGRTTEREVQDEDLETSYYRDDQIDLNELLREQFYLALPMKPLCQDELQGPVPAVRHEPGTPARATARRSGRIPRLARR